MIGKYIVTICTLYCNIFIVNIKERIVMFKNKNEKGKQGQDKSLTEIVVEQASQMSSQFDPLGSYTGNPADSSQKPIQDAGDL